MPYKRVVSTHSIIKLGVETCREKGHTPLCEEDLDLIVRSLDVQQEVLGEARENRLRREADGGSDTTPGPVTPHEFEQGRTGVCVQCLRPVSDQVHL